MRMLIALALCAGLAGLATRADEPTKGDKMSGPLQFTLNDIKGKPVELAQFKGKVVVFVNVASQCGYTRQYKGLQELYDKYKDDGLVVVGVPANDFGSQEPGTNEEIEKFCQIKYAVTFPVMAKVSVKGADKTPLYKFLTEKETNPRHAGEVGWNFEKFVVGRDGEVVARFKSSAEPTGEAMTEAVKKALAAK